MRRIDTVNFASCDLNGFSSVDDDILTTGTLTAEDIVTEVKNQQNSASDEKNLQEEEDSEALQAIRVVHNFYEATTENMQLICDLERIELDQKNILFRYKEADKNYRFLQCLSVNVLYVRYVFCFVIATLCYNNIISLSPLIALYPSLTVLSFTFSVFYMLRLLRQGVAGTHNAESVTSY